VVRPSRMWGVSRGARRRAPGLQADPTKAARASPRRAKSRLQPEAPHQLVQAHRQTRQLLAGGAGLVGAGGGLHGQVADIDQVLDRKSTRLNSSHVTMSYA